MNSQTTLPIDYGTLKLTFTALRKHIFKDKIYQVHILANMITIGPIFRDPNPKYRLEYNLQNIVYWASKNQLVTGFGIKYKKQIKYFQANPEHLKEFRKAITCVVSFCPITDFYIEAEQIGKGSFSQVHKGFKIDDSSLVAIKKVSSKDKKSNKENPHLLQNEIKILTSLSNETIVKILEVYKTEEFNYSIILEYIGGSCLSQNIESMKKMTCKWKEQDIKILMQQLLRSLAYIHSQKVIHRDIKPQNIMLVNGDYRYIKIIDFGLSITNEKQVGPFKILLKAQQMWHTRVHAARDIEPNQRFPEVLGNNLRHVQCWGSILQTVSYANNYFARLSRGISCFQGSSSDNAMSITNLYNFLNIQSLQYQSFLKCLLTKFPEDRISAIQALKHPYLADLTPVQLFECNSTGFFFSNLQHISPVNIKQGSQINDMEEVSIEIAEKEECKKVYNLDVRPSKISRQKTCLSTGGTMHISQVFDRFNSLQQNY